METTFPTWLSAMGTWVNDAFPSDFESETRELIDHNGFSQFHLLRCSKWRESVCPIPSFAIPLWSPSTTVLNQLHATTANMLRHLLTLLTSLSVCAAANLTSQIELIRNPPHHANYSPPYTPTPSEKPARLLIIGDVHAMLDQLEALLSKAD